MKAALVKTCPVCHVGPGFPCRGTTTHPEREEVARRDVHLMAAYGRGSR